MRKTSFVVTWLVVVIPFLSCVGKPVKGSPGTGFRICGSIMQTVAYCGGARPAKKILEKSGTNVCTACDYQSIINDRNISDLQIIFHRPCFYNQPCINYKGSLPHTAPPHSVSAPVIFIEKDVIGYFRAAFFPNKLLNRC